MEGPRRGVHLFELARPARGPFVRLQARARAERARGRTRRVPPPILFSRARLAQVLEAWASEQVA